jgi:hypothetical protein
VTLTALAARAIAFDVPVDPDAETAQRWLREELLKPEYQSSPSLLERFLDWLQGLFDSGPTLGLNPGAASLVIVLAVLVVGGIAYYVAGPVRLSRRAAASAVVFDADERSATELRAAADAAARAGDWATAVLERFRAVVRSLEERVVLDPRPGRTADEAADVAALRLPELRADLAQAARLFDDVCYGKVVVGPEGDQLLRSLDQRAQATRPQSVDLVGAQGAAGSPGATGRGNR